MAMVEYIFAFLVLAAVSIAFYFAYDRFFATAGKPVSDIYLEALRNLLDGKQESAFAHLRQVVTEDSQNLDAYLRLGQILRENGKPDRAVLVHKDLTLRGNLSASDKSAILEQLALDYQALDDSDMAEAALRELIDVRPGSRWGHVKLLKIYERSEKWDEAFDMAVKVLKLQGEKSKKALAPYKHKCGQALLAKKELHQARILYKEAISLDPAYVPAYVAIGDSYAAEDRLEDAVNFWKKLIASVPDKAHEVIERLKTALFDLGRFGEIQDICEDILSHSPANVEARLTLAEFHEKKGNLGRAEEILIRLVEDDPEHMKSVIELIRLYLEQDDRKKIDSLFRTLEGVDGNSRPPARDGVVDTTLMGI
jgi:lipopolysaccharide biosynthesis regulator YciM